MGWDGVLLWPEAPVNPCGLPPGRLRLAALFLPHLRLLRSLLFDREQRAGGRACLDYRLRIELETLLGGYRLAAAYGE
jgi:hypothetical protein